MGDDEDIWLTADELKAWLSYVAMSTLLEAALDRQLQRDSAMSHPYYQILAMLSTPPQASVPSAPKATVALRSQGAEKLQLQ